jgi:hypothetical protein
MRLSQFSLDNKVFLLFALAFLAAVAIWFATGFGIGVTPDSTVYMDAAQNLLNGRGLVALTASGELKPLTHYPPLYPSVLALLGFLGFSIDPAARLLNAFLFGANVLLVGIALTCFSRKSFWLPILGALLTLTAPDIAGIHTSALSEGLFIFLAISGLVSLAHFLETKQGTWLVASAGFIGLALLARYVGVVLVFTGVVALLFVNSRNLRRRFVDAVIFGPIACAPMTLWVVRNMAVAGGASDRQFVFHPIGLRQIAAGLSTLSTWLLLGKVRTDYRVMFFVIEVLVTALVVIYLWTRTRKDTLTETDDRDDVAAERMEHREGKDLSRMPVVLSLFIVSYVGFLIFTASFVDADTVLDTRALVPVHVAAILLGLCFTWKLFESSKERALRIASVLLALLFVVSYSLRGVSWFLHVRQDGQGYASRAWKESETISKVKNLPSNMRIYSNGYDAIYYLTGRRAIYLPEKINHNTGRPNENYETELEKMRTDLEQGNAVLVYLRTLPERWFLPSEAELVQRLRPRSVEPTADGSIFSVAE